MSWSPQDSNKADGNNEGKNKARSVREKGNGKVESSGNESKAESDGNKNKSKNKGKQRASVLDRSCGNQFRNRGKDMLQVSLLAVQ